MSATLPDVGAPGADGHDWLYASDHQPPPAKSLLTVLRDELFVSAVELRTAATRTKLLGDSRRADALGASAAAVTMIGARVEQLMGLADGN